jgi:hypothetical protein
VQSIFFEIDSFAFLGYAVPEPVKSRLYRLGLCFFFGADYREIFPGLLVSEPDVVKTPLFFLEY